MSKKNVPGGWGQKKYFRELRKQQIGQYRENNYLRGQVSLIASKIDRLSDMLEDNRKVLQRSVHDGFHENMAVQSENHEEIKSNIREINKLLRGLKDENITLQRDNSNQLQELLKKITSVYNSLNESMIIQSESRKAVSSNMKELKELQYNLKNENLAIQKYNFDQLQELMKIIIANDLLKPIESEFG